MLNIRHIIVIMGLLTVPAFALAQNDEPQKKSEIKVGKLDVIYEEEEFKGVEIDQNEEEETEQYLYQAPFLKNYDNEEDEEGSLQPFTLDDEGVDSEEDIILEAFDTMAIHLPKLNPASITEPIVLDLPKFSWPTPTSARVSSHFGRRRRRWHYGLDLAQPTGEPIYAAFDGVVRISKRNKSYGNLVIIHHANGLETYYAHMSQRDVAVGDHVKSGQLIGLCGNTGRSFGSHLHFEIRYMGNAMNPEDVLDCSTHDLISHQLTLTSNSFRKVGNSRVGGKSSGGGGTATNASSGWYRVRQGDTLEKIARRNGTTVKRLCQLNGIKATSTLRVGQKLKVSGSASKTAPAQSSSSAKGGTTYTVRSGDTLYSIAKRNGTTVKKICQLNGISENSKLRVGQKLRVK